MGNASIHPERQFRVRTPILVAALAALVAAVVGAIWQLDARLRIALAAHGAFFAILFVFPALMVLSAYRWSRRYAPPDDERGEPKPAPYDRYDLD
jgi:hypothetical protein